MPVVRNLAALFAGVALLLMGSGLLGTLLAVRGRIENFDDQTMGLIMSGYFVGFFLGTYLAPGLIQRIGHIRAFAFYSALVAAAILLHPVFVNPLAWGALRVLTGVGLVGLYTVIESWLNVQAPPDKRSQVFAVYMAVNLLALAAGQWFISFMDPSTFVLFSVVAIFICVAALPVVASRMVQPTLPAVPRLALAALWRAAPAAATGSLLAGLAMGGFWGMGAVYATGLGLDLQGIAALMSATILGGALLQWPIGRASDRGDRRTTLAIICAIAAVIGVAMMFAADRSHFALFGLFFLFGGVAFAIYPLCVAHLLDHLPVEDTLSGCSSLLLLNGVGSAIGPALAGAAMVRFGPSALPASFAIVLGALAIIAAGRRLIRQRDRDHPSVFHPMLRTTPSALELLPETGPAPEGPDLSDPHHKDPR
ncbi:MAG: MFS transporter [Luteimonas sp.]